MQVCAKEWDLHLNNTYHNAKLCTAASDKFKAENTLLPTIPKLQTHKGFREISKNVINYILFDRKSRYETFRHT